MRNELSVLFIPTSNSGVAYWRMHNFDKAAFTNKAFYSHMIWWNKKLTEVHPWQFDISSDVHYARILNEMDSKVRLADVVVMQMCHTEAALALFHSIRDAYRIPVLVEIDDNMVSTAEYNAAHDAYAPGSDLRRIAIDQFKAADGIIVTTDHLKGVYSEFNPHIYVVPNCIDFKVWGNNKRKKHDNIRIGWAGGASHSEDLRLILPAMKTLLQKHKNIEFVFVHGIPEFLKNIPRVRTITKFSRIDKYPSFISSLSFDIGIAPLVDNAFNRSKSNLRWLENAAYKIPCVASKVGHFAETITDGVDGFLCEDAESFGKRLEELIVNKQLRKTIGINGYEKVQSDFNVDKIIFKYGEYLQEVKARGQVYKPELEKPKYPTLDSLPTCELEIGFGGEGNDKVAITDANGVIC